MWEAIKNALSSVKEATGIEIPGLPADLGSIGESASTALGSVTESVTGGLGGLTETATAATESVTGMGEAATAAVDSATQGLPDIAGGLIGGTPGK